MRQIQLDGADTDGKIAETGGAENRQIETGIHGTLHMSRINILIDPIPQAGRKCDRNRAIARPVSEAEQIRDGGDDV